MKAILEFYVSCISYTHRTGAILLGVCWSLLIIYWSYIGVMLKSYRLHWKLYESETGVMPVTLELLIIVFSCWSHGKVVLGVVSVILELYSNHTRVTIAHAGVLL